MSSNDSQLTSDQRFLREVLVSFSGELFESWEKTGAETRKIYDDAELLERFERVFSEMMQDDTMTFRDKVRRYALGGIDRAMKTEESSRQFLLKSWEAIMGKPWDEQYKIVQ